MKTTKIKLDFIKDNHSLQLLENNIRGGISSVIGPRYSDSDENTKLLYIDANIFSGWAMSQNRPTGDFEMIKILENGDSLLIDDIKKDIKNT